MQNWLIDNWRSYVWVPSGEVIRGVETTFLTAFIQTALAANPRTLEHPRTWLVAALVGAALPALGYLKGKVPQASNDPVPAPPAAPGAPA